MSKYKFKGNPSEYQDSVIKGVSYSEETLLQGVSLRHIAREYPEDWEKVSEQEKPKVSFKKIYDSLLRMQEAKDKAYGNSALKPLNIFAKHHNYGARIDEKLSRVQNSSELRKNDVADIIGGLILICKDKGWDYFDDLID